MGRSKSSKIKEESFLIKFNYRHHNEKKELYNTVSFFILSYFILDYFEGIKNTNLFKFFLFDNLLYQFLFKLIMQGIFL